MTFTSSFHLILSIHIYIYMTNMAVDIMIFPKHKITPISISGEVLPKEHNKDTITAQNHLPLSASGVKFPMLPQVSVLGHLAGLHTL